MNTNIFYRYPNGRKKNVMYGFHNSYGTCRTIRQEMEYGRGYHSELHLYSVHSSRYDRVQQQKEHCEVSTSTVLVTSRQTKNDLHIASLNMSIQFSKLHTYINIICHHEVRPGRPVSVSAFSSLYILQFNFDMAHYKGCFSSRNWIRQM